MSQRISIGIVLVLGIVSVVSIWALLKPNETDVYMAALKPYSELSPVLYSYPNRCGLQSPEREGIDGALLDRFLGANSDDTNSISLYRLNGLFAIADTSKLDSYISAGVSPSVLISGERKLVGLSRVGFSSDGKKALFCIVGIGTALIQLQKVAGQWQEVNYTQVAIP